MCDAVWCQENDRFRRKKRQLAEIRGSTIAETTNDRTCLPNWQAGGGSKVAWFAVTRSKVAQSRRKNNGFGNKLVVDIFDKCEQRVGILNVVLPHFRIR